MTPSQRMAALIVLAPLFLATECGTEAVNPSRSCEIQLETPEPAEGEVGAEIHLTARSMTTLQDTRLLVGGTDATLLSVDREGCDACDDCVLETECSPCGDCDACDAICETECSESVRFVVPDKAPGEAAITLYNLYGNSDPVPFIVVEPNALDDTASP